MKKPYDKEHVTRKLCEVKDKYREASAATNDPAERLANQLGEMVMERLMIEFEKEFE